MPRQGDHVDVALAGDVTAERNRPHDVDADKSVPKQRPDLIRYPLTEGEHLIRHHDVTMPLRPTRCASPRLWTAVPRDRCDTAEPGSPVDESPAWRRSMTPGI